MTADCLRLSTVNNAALCLVHSVKLSLKPVGEREENGTHIKNRLTICREIIQTLLHVGILYPAVHIALHPSAN